MIDLVKRSFRRWRGRKRWQRPLTLTGRFFFITAIVCGHGLIDPTILPLLAFVLSILFVSVLTSLFYRPKISIRVQEPPLVSVGETIDFRIVLTNLRNRPAYDLHVQCIDIPAGWQLTENEHFVSSIEHGSATTLRFTALTVRRGVYRLPPIRISSTFPFGLFRQSLVVRGAGSSVIAPAYNSQALRLETDIQGINFDDLHGRRQVSSSLEYVGSREYQPGVPVRRWDFVSWARIGTPTVCEYIEGTHRNALIVVDLERLKTDCLSSENQFDRFETLLSKAAAVVNSLCALQYDCWMILVGKSLKIISPSGHHDTRHQMFAALAMCELTDSIHWGDVTRLCSDCNLPSADIFAVLGQHDLDREAFFAMLKTDDTRLSITIIDDEASMRISACNAKAKLQSDAENQPESGLSRGYA